MSIFIDSAVQDEISDALSLGYVSGVTTNPTLMAKVNKPWRKTLAKICNICSGPIFYQIDVDNENKLEDAAHAIHEISRSQIVLKLPASQPYFKLARTISSRIKCCITAVYSEAQLLAAEEAGAKHAAVYVNRISKFFAKGEGSLKGDGIATLESMRELIERQSLGIKILAASLKSSDEAMLAMKAGAHNITATLDVLKSLSSHPLTEMALEEFQATIRG